jgi:hypothetical protein
MTIWWGNAHIFRNRLAASIVNRIYEKIPLSENEVYLICWFQNKLPFLLESCRVYIHYDKEDNLFEPGVEI